MKMRVIFKDGSIANLDNVDQIIFTEPEVSVKSEKGVASWILHGIKLNKWMCTNCKKDSMEKSDFCPNCGFQMRNGLRLSEPISTDANVSLRIPTEEEEYDNRDEKTDIS